jgi:hypothetical protein
VDLRATGRPCAPRDVRPGGDRYRIPDGWTVEVVQLEAGKRLRIRHHGFYIADVRSADDLARWISADELVQLEGDTLILASHFSAANNVARAHTAGRR